MSWEEVKVGELKRGAVKEVEDALAKLPPQNIEAEQFILGAILMENDALYKSLENIVPDDFYKDAHRRIYAAMIALNDRNEAIDLITLTDYLQNKDELNKVGGVSYLSMLVNSVPTSANVLYHSRIVREKSVMRRLLTSANEIASNIYEGGLEADELVDLAEKRIFEISEKRIKAGFTSIDLVVKDSFSMIERLYEKRETITGIPSGFRDLDEMTTGFQEGDLIIIGGRPSMGKTAFSINIAHYVGCELRKPVAIFSLEMSKRQLALRMLSAEAMVDSNKIRKGYVEGQEWNKLTAAAGRLSNGTLFIDDTTDLGVLEVRAKSRRLKIEHGLGLIIIDYLQLMRGSGKYTSEQRVHEISNISRSLKSLARELNVPVIALSQLNRMVEQRKPPIPTLADLRESGAIEQDADLILFLYRDEVYNKNSAEVKGKAEVHIAKQRNGPTGIVKLTFLSNFTKFSSYTENHTALSNNGDEYIY
ncbi:replicative DNA helicase [Candidatus Magnetoovum chiemensis]|nr:replicative DNA helicase [Candidatus Magnetoovum chiemensis]